MPLPPPLPLLLAAVTAALRPVAGMLAGACAAGLREAETVGLSSAARVPRGSKYVMEWPLMLADPVPRISEILFWLHRRCARSSLTVANSLTVVDPSRTHQIFVLGLLAPMRPDAVPDTGVAA